MTMLVELWWFFFHAVQRSLHSSCTTDSSSSNISQTQRCGWRWTVRRQHVRVIGRAMREQQCAAVRREKKERGRDGKVLSQWQRFRTEHSIRKFVHTNHIMLRAERIAYRLVPIRLEPLYCHLHRCGRERGPHQIIERRRERNVEKDIYRERVY